MKNLKIYQNLKKIHNTPSAVRIFTEIDYALQLDKARGGIFSPVLDNVITYLGEVGAITQREVAHCETLMKEIGEEAKKQTVLCVAHAHIDVNWLWGYDETVAITLSTIETMLMLLEKYENFTFSQSTAFVFKTVEKYRPDLLSKIKKYISEGRFEITGSTFVEADKNAPDANSLLRHFEHSKKYLSKLFDLPESYFDTDFEPDTFGHTLYEPEILAVSGIKYLYHCRGNDLPPIYRWFAPGGKSVLVYREPFWYNAEIGYGDFEFVPDFCKRYGVSKVLKVYGVGDHGGGATMRDVDRISEIASYPVMANIKFGTYREFFRHLETLDGIPEIRGEQNGIFTGCYSSASEIKRANAAAQNALFEQELFCSVDGSRGYDNAEGVECLLTNGFHDVITGSGVQETAHFAMAEYQRANAQFGAFKAQALGNFEKKINTLPLFKLLAEHGNDTALGAGVGFGARQINFSNNISYGKERAYVIFNQLNFPRKAVVTLPIWDYCGDATKLRAYEGDLPLPFAIKSADTFYWSHNYREIAVEVALGANEYKTVVLRETDDCGVRQIEYPPLFQRTERTYGDITLENAHLRAVFDAKTFTVISLYDKATGTEKLSGEGAFKLLTEDITEQMTAWYVGRIKNVEDIQKNVTFISHTNDGVSQTLRYKFTFGQSYLEVAAVLENHARGLKFECECGFFEKGSPVDGVPDLRFELPVGEFKTAVCDTSPGIIERPAADMDRPCASFMSANGVAIIANGKHGFRGFKNLSLCLIRASCDPHPLPEYAKHCFTFGVYLAPATPLEQLRQSLGFRMPPVAISASPHAGSLPPSGKYADIPENAVCISARKESLTLFNPDDKPVKIGKTTITGKSIAVIRK